MKSISILVLVALAAVYTSGLPTSTGTVAPKDSFINLIKEIEQSSFFPSLSFERRLLTFEMLSAAETKHLKTLLDRLGYISLLEYLDDLPSDYQHRFIEYSVAHLEVENEYYGDKA